jgi:hypothetical protein
MVKAVTVRIEIEVHMGADEVDAEDLERWIFDPDELRPWPADASIRCAPTVHGLCTDEAEQAETPIDNRATWTARLQQIRPIDGSSRTLRDGR